VDWFKGWKGTLDERLQLDGRGMHWERKVLQCYHLPMSVLLRTLLGWQKV
jgi:hypothetical protein